MAACTPPRAPIQGTTGSVEYHLDLTDKGNVQEVGMRTDPSLQDPSPHTWRSVKAWYGGGENPGWMLHIGSPARDCSTYAADEGWFGNTYGPQGAPRGTHSRECPEDLAWEVRTTLYEVLGARPVGRD